MRARSSTAAPPVARRLRWPCGAPGRPSPWPARRPPSRGVAIELVGPAGELAGGGLRALQVAHPGRPLAFLGELALPLLRARVRLVRLALRPGARGPVGTPAREQRHQAQTG